MKKNYITPNINVVQVETICNGGILQASVHQESLKGVCISQFDVVGEEKTKIDAEYTGLWGKSNSDNWGED
ncbi:MAG: hypothetical protein ACLUV4_04915 [Prevotella sp.]